MIRQNLGKKKLLLLATFVMVIGGWLVYEQFFRKIELRLGIYTGSSWDVPNGHEYELIDRVIDRFEKAHPNVTVSYESGISKEDYSSWLSDTIINGDQPDIFILPENDFNLLASSGSLKKLNGFITKDLEVADFYDSAYQSGTYKTIQYALPFESNPTMMCINKDLLEKKGLNCPPMAGL